MLSPGWCHSGQRVLSHRTPPSTMAPRIYTQPEPSPAPQNSLYTGIEKAFFGAAFKTYHVQDYAAERILPSQRGFLAALMLARARSAQPMPENIDPVPIVFWDQSNDAASPCFPQTWWLFSAAAAHADCFTSTSEGSDMLSASHPARFQLKVWNVPCVCCPAVEVHLCCHRCMYIYGFMNFINTYWKSLSGSGQAWVLRLLLLHPPGLKEKMKKVTEQQSKLQ